MGKFDARHLTCGEGKDGIIGWMDEVSSSCFTYDNPHFLRLVILCAVTLWQSLRAFRFSD
jgi:hypothetical protein